jgi:hypothetical protein
MLHTEILKAKAKPARILIIIFLFDLHSESTSVCGISLRQSCVLPVSCPKAQSAIEKEWSRGLM